MGAAVLAATVTAHAGQAAAPATAAGPVAAASASPITDHLAIEGIFFYGGVGTDGRFNAPSGTPGTPFRAERDLGLSDRAVQPRVELLVRLEQRNRVRLNFLDLRRGGNAVLDRTIQYGTQTFAPATRLRSEVDWRQTDLTYTYSFWRNDRVELGAGLGVHLIETEASARAPNSPQRADYSAAGPFATVALDGIWRFARHWSLNARGQYFRLSVSSGSGALGIYHADVQYRWRANFAVGAGYEYQQVELQVHHQDVAGLNGTVQLKIAAPELFVRLSL